MSDQINEQELLGIGRRYSVQAEGGAERGDPHSGRRDVYLGDGTGRTPPAVASLTDDQARRLGAVLAGAYFQPTLTRQSRGHPDRAAHPGARAGSRSGQPRSADHSGPRVGRRTGASRRHRDRRGLHRRRRVRGPHPEDGPVRGGRHRPHRAGPGRVLPYPGQLAVVAGLDGRLGPFTAGYVLVLAIAGPLAASRSHILAGLLPARLFPAPAASRKDSS